MKRKIFITKLCLLCLCAAHLPAAAHVLDQYLQVVQIALAPNGVRIELRLIPRVQVTERICTLIDTDGDRQITKAEEQAYLQHVSQDIELSISNIKTPLRLTNSQFPTQQEMREGLGTIRLTYEASSSLVTADYQQLSFRNNHLPELSNYLVNALVPATPEIKIGGQERDPLQREMKLNYRMTGATNLTPPLQVRWRVLVLCCLCFAVLYVGWILYNRPGVSGVFM